MATTQELAQAIARQEGAKLSAGGYRNNNPGNIMDLDYYRQTGQYRPQVYSTEGEGWQALYGLIGRRLTGATTLREFFYKYAPFGHGSNDPDIYAEHVGQWTGLDPDSPISLDRAGGAGIDLPLAPPGPSEAPTFSVNVFGETPAYPIEEPALASTIHPALLIGGLLFGVLALYTATDRS
jgi:hypothetical protein